MNSIPNWNLKKKKQRQYRVNILVCTDHISAQWQSNVYARTAKLRMATKGLKQSWHSDLSSKCRASYEQQWKLKLSCSWWETSFVSVGCIKPGTLSYLNPAELNLSKNE